MKVEKSVIISCVFMLCSMCMFSQVPNSEKKNYKRTTIAATANEISIASPDLNAIWKDGYKYAIVIPKNSRLKTYNKLQGMLLNPEYTKDNTLVFCSSEELKLTEEACGGRLHVYGFLNIGDKNSEIKVYSIQKIEDDYYDYRLVPKAVD